MDKALQFLSIARKAGLIAIGEEPVAGLTQARAARLVLTAADASEPTARRVRNQIAGTKQPLLRLPYTKSELGYALGVPPCAVCALKDYALALEVVRALGASENTQLEQELAARAARAHRRKAEKGKPRSTGAGRGRARHGGK